MGRWAQRRRGAGGGGTAETFIVITTNHKDSFTQSTVTYSANVNSGDFAAADFVANPFGGSVTGVAQGASNQLVLTWDDIENETSLTFSGLVPNIETPQTVLFT